MRQAEKSRSEAVWADLREAVDRSLVELSDEGERIAVVLADSSSTSRLTAFNKAFPHRVLNVGIAEQNMVGVAVGLSLGGYTSFTANAAPFLLSRANEQVKNDVCYSNSNVKMLGLNAGVTYGALGSTHHILDDLAILRGLGNIRIFAPSDAVEAASIVRSVCSFHGPAYIRLDKLSFPLFHGDEYTFKLGKLDPLQEGEEAVIFSMGTMLAEAARACDILNERGVSTALYNVPSIRPLHSEEILKAVSGKGAVITVEEHSTHGGIGSLISSTLFDAGFRGPVGKVGFPEGIFVKAGPREEIRRFYGLEATSIAAKAERLLGTYPRDLRADSCEERKEP